MKYVPIPYRLSSAVRTSRRPSPLPAVLIVVVLFSLLGWVQAEDQAALERDRATLQQLAREASGISSAPQATEGERK